MIVILFVSCMVLFPSRLSATHLVLDEMGKRVRIPVLEIGMVRYVPLEALQGSSRMHHRADAFHLGAWTLQWSAPSFFFLLENHDVRLILQSIYPSIVRNGKILLPLDECMQLLAQHGVVRWDRQRHRVEVLQQPNRRKQQRIPPHYQLPPSIRRPSIEQFKSRAECRQPCAIVTSSPLLASATDVWLDRYQESVSIERIASQISRDTTRIVFALSRELPPESVHLNHRGNTIRFVLDGVTGNPSTLAPLRKIRLRQYKLEQSVHGVTIQLELLRSDRMVRAFFSSARTLVLEIAPQPRTLRRVIDCIVLDPGHGGHDCGAIGVRGTFEKTITLAVAKRLERHLASSLPGVRVLLTRRDDRFVELHRRTEIANKAGGKVFISLHCNAAATKPHTASGVEVYVLSPARTDEAARVALRENASIEFERDQSRYPASHIEQRILASAAQHGMLDLSHLLAASIDSTLHHMLGVQSRGVQSAGFLVLVGAVMPSVLVELGFLTNVEEERLLRSQSYQERIAQALATAIADFVRHYEQIHTLSGAVR